MRYWRDQGAPLEKLLVGFPAYGRTFRTSSATSGVGAPASGSASAGPFTREAGFWSYYEVVIHCIIQTIYNNFEKSTYIKNMNSYCKPK